MKKNSFIKLECGTLVQVVATKEKMLRYFT